jgi:hypothetical protein
MNVKVGDIYRTIRFQRVSYYKIELLFHRSGLRNVIRRSELEVLSLLSTYLLFHVAFVGQKLPSPKLKRFIFAQKTSWIKIHCTLHATRLCQMQ